MIRSLHALGRHIRKALGDDPAAIVEQLVLTSADDDGESDRGERSVPGTRQVFLGVLDFCPGQGVLRHRIEEVSPEALRRYLWIQLTKFSTSGDIRDVTVKDSNLKFLIGPVFAGLAPGSSRLSDSQYRALNELSAVLAPARARLRDYGGRGRDRFLLDLKQKIDAERENNMDNERQRRLLDEWILAISDEMRRRLD
jgi:hypothetical protein